VYVNMLRAGEGIMVVRIRTSARQHSKTFVTANNTAQHWTTNVCADKHVAKVGTVLGVRQSFLMRRAASDQASGMLASRQSAFLPVYSVSVVSTNSQQK